MDLGFCIVKHTSTNIMALETLKIEQDVREKVVPAMQ